MMKCLLAALLVFGALLPAAGRCQPPTLQATWTSHGSHGLGRPWHLAFDAAGNVYVTDPAMCRVFVFTAGGDPVTSWNCPAVAPLDFFPEGIAVSTDGHAYITTPSTNGPPLFLLSSFTIGGDYLGPLGTMGAGPGQLGRPMDVAVDGGGTLYLADNANFRVEVLASSGDYVRQWGGWGTGPGAFHFPLAIAVSPSGLVYVTDDDNQRIQVFTTSGAFVTQWGSCGAGPGQFAGPWGIALDATGNVYVADASNNRIQVFTSTGQFLTQWGTYGTGPGQFYKPIGVGVGPDGRVYVADSWNSRIQVFGPVATPTKATTWGRIKALYR
jgi:tripartite motif-containing protein 71